jgi:signal-transduction protein with cAMP-binding, CBS, and nucleotidyltransferase domain
MEQFSAHIIRREGAVAVAVAGMRRRLVTIEPGASIEEAARLMRAQDVSALVVGTPHQRIALVTERDVTHSVADGRPPDAEVGSIATPDPATIDVGATVMTAAVTMVELGVRHLVVVDDRRRAVGLVSIRDVMAELLRPTW